MTKQEREKLLEEVIEVTNINSDKFKQVFSLWLTEDYYSVLSELTYGEETNFGKNWLCVYHNKKLVHGKEVSVVAKELELYK